MRLFSILIFFIFSRLYASDIEELISEGSAHNNFFLYEDAIPFLNEAIRREPSAKEAYKERALSYFELNKIDLAFKDYKQVIEDLPPPYRRYNRNFLGYTSILENTLPSLDFAKGLLHGTLLGGRESTIEFVSSIRGGLTFLWSFACSPIDVSKELIETLYEIGELLASGRICYLLEEALPELFECGKYWDTWSDYTKGQKLGFIIGKYSILAFFTVTTFKGGAYFYNKLKRANIMAILERYSLKKSPIILEESAKHAKKSETILKKAANGSIVAHNPNVLPHVFTKKHQWDKFIKLTGDHEKDFEKLVAFLENQKILQCSREIDYAHKGVITYKYTREIGKDKIIALFEINKKNVPLLKNAWVEAKIP